MALHAKKFSFDKVIAMVDDMVALLAKEQVDDNDRRKYARCSWTRLRRI